MADNNEEELLTLAKEAARTAAQVHYQAEAGHLQVGTKGSPTDLVTAVDREAERRLTSIIHSARPDDSIIGEEGASVAGSSGVTWILDPLDGTTNFVYGYPGHALAIGVEVDGKRLLGVVVDTYHKSLYWGIVGKGAFCDDRAITAGSTPDLGRALIATGFLPDIRVRKAQGEVLTHILPLVRDVRRSGCPALDFCAVAAGTLDAYYESGLKAWDIAAGAAIAEAAGATVVELHSDVLPSPVVIAANGRLVETLAAALAAAETRRPVGE